ncbi:Uncharacterised protein [Vibrio cholerae]|uniref:Uncharacterized protein n=1 Tax=Vibrio cholerae TaxID=666 RepID=A0A655ZNY3_VIBCL|nr:Uncharacterised protein [Vibrio cholerae]CSC75979.1 Uncharacterised protein [Vibrio cholerae]CSI34893.1 Uncharacterised protein [Vibrio cholerae]
MNEGTFASAILISSPVFGLRPVRAARVRTLNVPKPTSATWSPDCSVPLTASMNASRARPAEALEISAFAAICSTSCVLFTVIPLWSPFIILSVPISFH